MLTVGAVSALLSQPVIGRLSDRTRAVWLGRRNTWVLGCGVVSASALMIVSTAPNVVVLGIIWACALWPLNGVQAAAGAALPDRVPVAYRARLSALGGMAALVGLGLGLGVGIGGLVDDVRLAYAILAVQLLASSAAFAFLTRDVAGRTDSRTERTRIPSWHSHRDFWWVFIGRFLAFLAYSMAIGLQLFALRDHFVAGAGTTDAARGALVTVTAVSLLPLVLSAIVGGILADKLGGLKTLVILSTVLFMPAGLVLALWPSMSGALVGFALLSLGFGAYISVDGALATVVLPHPDDAARDLGVLNIAVVGPQIIAPALAGGVVALGGYLLLFLVVVAVSGLASGAVLFVRGAR